MHVFRLVNTSTASIKLDKEVVDPNSRNKKGKICPTKTVAVAKEFVTL